MRSAHVVPSGYLNGDPVAAAVTTSRLPGFHEHDREGRRKRLVDEAGVDPETLEALDRAPEDAVLEEMSENVLGRLTLPIGVATNVVVDGDDVLVPMATEESSVVAAASHAAKTARPHGGFQAEGGRPEMVAQVHLVDVDVDEAQATVEDHADELVAGLRDPEGSMEKRGGGPRELSTHRHDLPEGDSALSVHLVADVRDAMGANYVNELAERLAPRLEDLTGGRALLRILSNLARRRVVRVEATFDREELGGRDVVEDIVTANRIARADTCRAATHNKGVMNGITAVMLATGNDTRAQEAGAHAWAAREGRYQALTRYEVTEEGHLHGRLEVPVQAGVVGGATSSLPSAQAALELMGEPSGPELARIAASVGMAQNVAALRALVAEGIQEGHMRLHAANLARQAGVGSDQIDDVAERMVEADDVSASAARRFAEDLEG
ncbi:hydroxymethylglutaryl-CoA reductase, degradative [Thermoplasmatales archaeon SW_10_69_26]|nr:MAG: hydroxymethylglutaryl-CoA reductase, degradative [Thermoplasmatales archaeon SW_10_69_26]